MGFSPAGASFVGVLFEISIVCLFFVPFLFCFWFLACLVSFGWLWCLLAVLVGGCCGWLRGWGGLFELIWVWIGFLGYWNGLRADLGGFFGCFGWCVVCFFFASCQSFIITALTIPC